MNESLDDNNPTNKKNKNASPIKAIIQEDSVLVEDHQDARIIYDNGFYGMLNKDKTLTLNFEEALHLYERGVISILNDSGTVLGISECTTLFSKREKGFWNDYLVYKDLRNRGYIINRGISDLVKYRLYPRGAKIGKTPAKTMICPLAEGQSINLDKLDKIVVQIQSIKKELLIACVDRLGDVSYYELQALFTS